MKKSIRMRMTAEKAKEYGYKPVHDLGVGAVEVDLDKLSEGARWIAEHISATYVIDEVSDRIDIKAVSDITMEERDRKKGVSEEKIAAFKRMYGSLYSEDKLAIDEISFPILSASKYNINTPEGVIEKTYKELCDCGAKKLVAKSGEEFTIK